MFCKPFKIKCHRFISNAEVKAIQSTLQHVTFGGKLELLLKEAAPSFMRVVTQDGIRTVIYCAKQLMFFEYDGGMEEEHMLVPTVFALWLVPDILPKIMFDRGVLSKMLEAVDTNLWDMSDTEMTYDHLPAHTLVAFYGDDCQLAAGVAVLLPSGFLKILHVIGDHLWSHNAQLLQQNRTKLRTFLQGDKIISSAKTAQPQHPKGGTEEVSSENVTADANLRNAFLVAIKKHGKNMQLPMLTSCFYRLYVMPQSEHPIVLKQTKYKQLSHFLHEVMQQGFITLSQTKKGIHKIIAINLDHEELVNIEIKLNLEQQEFNKLYAMTRSTARIFWQASLVNNENVKKMAQKILKTQPMTLHKRKQNQNRQLYSKTQFTQQIRIYCLRLDGHLKTVVENFEVHGIASQTFVQLCRNTLHVGATIVKRSNGVGLIAKYLLIQGKHGGDVKNLLTKAYDIPAAYIECLELKTYGKKRKPKNQKIYKDKKVKRKRKLNKNILYEFEEYCSERILMKREQLRKEKREERKKIEERKILKEIKRIEKLQALKALEASKALEAVQPASARSKRRNRQRKRNNVAVLPERKESEPLEASARSRSGNRNNVAVLPERKESEALEASARSRSRKRNNFIALPPPKRIYCTNLWDFIAEALKHRVLNRRALERKAANSRRHLNPEA